MHTQLLSRHVGKPRVWPGCSWQGHTGTCDRSWRPPRALARGAAAAHNMQLADRCPALRLLAPVLAMLWLNNAHCHWWAWLAGRHGISYWSAAVLSWRAAGRGLLTRGGPRRVGGALVGAWKWAVPVGGAGRPRIGRVDANRGHQWRKSAMRRACVILANLCALPIAVVRQDSERTPNAAFERRPDLGPWVASQSQAPSSRRPAAPIEARRIMRAAAAPASPALGGSARRPHARRAASLRIAAQATNGGQLPGRPAAPKASAASQAAAATSPIPGGAPTPPSAAATMELQVLASASCCSDAALVSSTRLLLRPRLLAAWTLSNDRPPCRSSGPASKHSCPAHPASQGQASPWFPQLTSFSRFIMPFEEDFNAATLGSSSMAKKLRGAVAAAALDAARRPVCVQGEPGEAAARRACLCLPSATHTHALDVRRQCRHCSHDECPFAGRTPPVPMPAAASPPVRRPAQAPHCGPDPLRLGGGRAGPAALQAGPSGTLQPGGRAVWRRCQRWVCAPAPRLGGAWAHPERGPPCCSCPLLPLLLRRCPDCSPTPAPPGRQGTAASWAVCAPRAGPCCSSTCTRCRRGRCESASRACWERRAPAACPSAC